MSKHKNKEPLNNHDGGISYSGDKNKVLIDFCDNEKNESSELLEFKFVVDSYFESAFTLLNEVEKYVLADNFNKKKICLLKYLPAFFCFRHYVELKLKYLFMKDTGCSFNTKEHTLSNLLEELKNETGTSYAVFDRAITYIEKQEKIVGNQKQTAYSRYLVDTNFNFSKNILIVLDDIKTMKTLLKEIEGRLDQVEQVKTFNKWLNDKKD